MLHNCRRTAAEHPGCDPNPRGYLRADRAECSVEEPIANSSMFVLLTMGIPAWCRRRHGCVVGRQPAFKDLRRAGRRQASGHHIVLHGDRNAGQAREIFTCSATSIDLSCSCKCAFTINVEESVDLGIDRINTVEACLSEFNRR